MVPVASARSGCRSVAVPGPRRPVFVRAGGLVTPKGTERTPTAKRFRARSARRADDRRECERGDSLPRRGRRGPRRAQREFDTGAGTGKEHPGPGCRGAGTDVQVGPRVGGAEDRCAGAGDRDVELLRRVVCLTGSTASDHVRRGAAADGQRGRARHRGRRAASARRGRPAPDRACAVAEQGRRPGGDVDQGPPRDAAELGRREAGMARGPRRKRRGAIGGRVGPGACSRQYGHPLG